jgi:Bacteriophage HK97-gp10, putative tail-component
MTDGIVAHFLKGSVVEAKRDMHALDTAADRASMWALREVGRRVKREAKARARVYQGDRKDIEKRALRKSIASSKRLRREANGTRSLKVGPRGWRVHLYAGKIEELEPYMAPAYAVAIAEAHSVHERALERALKRAGH